MTGTREVMADPARSVPLAGQPVANRIAPVAAAGSMRLAPALAAALAWLALTHACCLTGSMRAADAIGGFPICHAAKPR